VFNKFAATIVDTLLNYSQYSILETIQEKRERYGKFLEVINTFVQKNREKLIVGEDHDRIYPITLWLRRMLSQKGTFVAVLSPPYLVWLENELKKRNFHNQGEKLIKVLDLKFKESKK